MCKQAVDAVEVDERAEVGEVLHRAGHGRAGHHGFEERLTLLAAFALNEFATAEDDVAAVVVDFDNAEIVGVAEEHAEVLRLDDVDLRAGAERLDADIDHEAAFDDALHLALDQPVAVIHADDLFPVLTVERFFAREHDHALVVFEPLEQHVDLVALLQTFDVIKFPGRDDAFALVADVHEHFAGSEFKDVAFDNGAFAKITHGFRDEFLHSSHKRRVRATQTSATVTVRPDGLRVDN